MTRRLWRERGLATTGEQSTVPAHWCRCKGEGTCMGCLLLGLIQKHYGTAGVMYLLDAIKAGDRND